MSFRTSAPVTVTLALHRCAVYRGGTLPALGLRASRVRATFAGTAQSARFQVAR